MSATLPLAKIAQQMRRDSLMSTTEAGSGHPSTCLSCAEIMSVLFFDEMRFDPLDPKAYDVDVFVLSKGHAAPILWSALKHAGGISEDLKDLRKFTSTLEGHPTPRNPWVRVATGSLGQGLGAACGMAWARKQDGHPGRVFTLMGDGEVAEGSVFEAAAFASHEGLTNLVAIVDVNAFGQSGPTMQAHETGAYASRFEAFGWQAVECEGHDIAAVQAAFARVRNATKPSIILARTLKGKGAPIMEDKDGWHGKPVKKGEELESALAAIGEVDLGEILVPSRRYGHSRPAPAQFSVSPAYKTGDLVATREAYGSALEQIGSQCASIVGVDGDTKNSTFSDRLKKARPAQFVDAYIAEQNMVSVALGVSTEGKIPFASSFACFLSRAYDQIRMAGHSEPSHLVIVGSHAGVSIGEDGQSQMALEDLAMMRGVIPATVFYPSDAVSAEKLTELAGKTPGVVYLRMSRPKTAILYPNEETFVVGGSKVLRSSAQDAVTVVGAGVTLHEALAAHAELASSGIAIRVIDLYSLKPVDTRTLLQAAAETTGFVTVEDHGACGGLGEAVASAVAGRSRIEILAVRELPRSGTPTQLMHAYGIDKDAIVSAVKRLLA
ncbi:MAG: transketolase [Vicinamibacteria bacterium]|nr:transketolase [Vicinamibacteria bacterium]